MQIGEKMYGMSITFGGCYNWEVASILWATAWSCIGYLMLAIVSIFKPCLARKMAIFRPWAFVMLACAYVSGLYQTFFFLKTQSV
jgi:hypothetical protein